MALQDTIGRKEIVDKVCWLVKKMVTCANQYFYLSYCKCGCVDFLETRTIDTFPF